MTGETASRRRAPSPSLAGGLALALRVLVAAVILLADTGIASELRFRIPAQPANAALNEYGRVTGRNILFPYDVLGEYRTNAVIGKYDTDKALDVLLRDTGLMATSSDKGNIIIKPVSGESAMKKEQGLFGGLLAILAAPMAAVSGGQAFAQQDAESTNAPRTLEEIVVTAERRQEQAQDVPISMTVYSGDFVRTHIEVAEDVTNLTPNFQMTGITGGIGLIENRASIRGVGSDDANNPLASTSNLVYYDGIASGTTFTSAIPPWDLERIEVARGPQGTLFGRNAVGGLVQYISAGPTDELEGYSQFTAGEFDLRRFEGAVSGPITDNVQARVSALSYHRDGDVDNTFLNIRQGAKDWWGARAILDWQASDELDFRVKVQHFDGAAGRLSFNATPENLVHPDGVAFLDAIGGDADFSRESNFERTQLGHPDSFDDMTLDMAEVDVQYDFGPVAMTAIGGYLEGDSIRNFDVLEYPAPLIEIVNFAEVEQWSGEIRFTSQTEQPFQWIAGAYYQRTEDSFAREVDFTGILRDLDGDGLTRHNADSPEDMFDGLTPNPGFAGAATIFQDTANAQDLDTYAFFLHTTYDWTDRLTTSHAVRFTHEEKEMDYRFVSFFEFPVRPGINPGTLAQHLDFVNFSFLTPAEQRQQAVSIIADANTVDENGNVIPQTLTDSWEEATWRLAADYRLQDDVLVYGSVSKGFRGGIFSIFSTPATAAAADPETSIVYEVGAKTQWFDNRLQINAGAFYNDLSDIQTNLLVVAPDGSNIFNRIENLPKSELYGGELEIRAVLYDDLLVAANFGVLDSEMTEVLPGNESLLGNELPFAEDMNFSGMLRYDISTASGTWSPELTWRYRGEYWSRKENDDVTGKLGDFWTLDWRIGYESPNGNLYGAFYLRNAFDEVQPVLNTFPPGAFLGISSATTVNERRNWGVMVGYRF